MTLNNIPYFHFLNMEVIKNCLKLLYKLTVNIVNSERKEKIIYVIFREETYFVQEIPAVVMPIPACMIFCMILLKVW